MNLNTFCFIGDANNLTKLFDHLKLPLSFDFDTRTAFNVALPKLIEWELIWISYQAA